MKDRFWAKIGPFLSLVTGDFDGNALTLSVVNLAAFRNVALIAGGSHSVEALEPNGRTASGSHVDLQGILLRHIKMFDAHG